MVLISAFHLEMHAKTPCMDCLYFCVVRTTHATVWTAVQPRNSCMLSLPLKLCLIPQKLCLYRTIRTAVRTVWYNLENHACYKIFLGKCAQIFSLSVFGNFAEILSFSLKLQE